MATNADISNRLVRDLVRDFDLPEEAAIGVVGNLAYESGGFSTLQEKKPVVPGSRGGYGYAQWTGPRRKAFEKYAKDNALDINSYEANYGYLKAELNSKEYKPLLKVLRDTTNIPFATQTFSAQFLRPGFKNYGQRDVYAEQVANNFRVATETSTTPPPVPMARDARPQPPAPLATPAGLNLPQPKPAALSGNPIFDINQTPRLNASGVVEYGNYPRAITAADMGAARQSLFQPPAPAFVSPGGVLPGATLTGQPRPFAPMTLANMPSSWITGIPTPAAPAQNAVRPGVPAGFPAAPQNMVRPAPLPTGYPRTTTPVASGVVSNPAPRPYAGVPNNAPAPIRNVTTQNVQRDGTVTTTQRAGTAALPTGYRPAVAGPAPALSPLLAGMGTRTPLTGPGGMTGTYKPPTVNPLTGYGGMTGTYYPPAKPAATPLTGFGGMTGTYYPPAQKKAPIPQMRPTVATGGGGTSFAPYSTGTSTGNYVVKPGETLGQIAARYGLTVNQLAQQSGVADPNRIAAGAKLVVPTSTTSGVKTTSSSGGSSGSSSGSSSGQTVTGGTFKGSSTGTTYKVGQVYSTASGGKVMAMADGTFKKV
jgi:hypothetical protein